MPRTSPHPVPLQSRTHPQKRGTPLLGWACAAALLGGTGLSLLFPYLMDFSVYLALCVLGLSGWLARWRGRIFGAFLFGIGWAGLHATLALDAQLPLALENRELAITGRIAGLPKHEARRTRFEFDVDSAEAGAHVLVGQRVVLAWYDEYGAAQPGPRLAVRAGERWQVRVRLRAPRGLRNPGGFDSERNALVQRIAATGYLRKPEQSAHRLESARGINAWREQMSARIGQGVHSNASRFLRALALGDTRGLRDDDWATLRAAGLTHLIAISGFHVGIVAAAFAALVGGLWRLFPTWARRIPRPSAMGLAAVMAAVGYAALAGFALPTVRTVLMMGVWALARLNRRPASVFQALSLALLAIVLVDPLSVLAAGFWLSFAGVAWLAWCLPANGEIHWLRGFLSSQAIATIGLLPLSVVLFDQASLAGPFINLIAIPWWSLVVVPVSLVGLALEACCDGAGVLVWNAAAWCFDASWEPFAWLAHTRFALWWLPESPGWALPLALLGAAWMLMPRGVPLKSLALLCWCPLLFPDTDSPRHGEVQLTIIDVGQGLSVLVRTAHHSLLYDMGPAMPDGFDAGERAVLPTLRALNVRRLERAVVSHGDNDHAGGFSSVSSAMTPLLTRVPGGMPALPTHSAVRAMECRAGDTWRRDDVEFRFLHPPRHFPYLRNESSCVLRIATAHGVALLTGDIGAVIERDLVRSQRQAIRADVVVVAHHGSGGSSAPSFVDATGARLALMSTGYGNRFGHPKPWVVERWRRAGAEVLDTAESGALQVWIGRDGLQLRERRHDRRRLWDAAERLHRLRRAGASQASPVSSGIREPVPP